LAQVIVAMAVAGDNYYAGQGIVLPPITPASGSFTVINGAALTAFATSGLSNGTAVYVETYRTIFTLQDAITLRSNEVLPSDDAAKVWVRDLGPSMWTYQYNWFYNKDIGDDENDGSELFPIKSSDEWCRRIRVISAGTNGTPEQYRFNLQTAIAATDTWFPSALIQADGTQIIRDIQPTIIGYRRAVTVPGGSGVLTANSSLAVIATRSKATLTDTNAVLTTLKYQMVMCADVAIAASGSGATASLSAVGGIVTLTGGTGYTIGSVNRMVIISGAATPANNGAFPITKFISSTSVEYSNPNATATDANNGAISWVEKPSKFAWIINPPAFTTGAGVTVTAVNAGIATLDGFPAATFSSAAVGKRIRMTLGIAANNGEFTIVEFVSATSVKIANSAAVVDATVQTFQGVVEVGRSWLDTATLLESATAPLNGSPYTVIEIPDVPQDPWGVGKPAGLGLAFVDCKLSSNNGLSSGQEARPTTCQVTNGGWLAGQNGTSLQGLMFATACCWGNPAAGFSNLIFKENGYNRTVDCCFVGHNILYREGLTLFNAFSSMVQGGYIGPAGEEAASRFGSAAGLVINGNRGLAIFNNVENSNTNPSVASGSAGSAMVLGRDSRCMSSTAGGGKIWGVGALGGMHIKEGSRFFSSISNLPNLTDTAGQAGFPVSEVKFGGQNPIPVPSVITGVPTAIATTSGVATTFVAVNGIVTITDPAAVFTVASVGRTVTIAGANTPANNGTYPIQSFIGATSVTIRNPNGVTDAVAAGTMTENAVITKWSQLGAAPYSGNAQNFTDGSASIRVIGS